VFWDVTLYCWENNYRIFKWLSSCTSWLYRTTHYAPLKQWNFSPKDPASYHWRPTLFNIECLTTILQNKFFIFLIAKAISNIIINNKLQFCRSFGAVSICCGLKMGIWVTVQLLYTAVKKTNSCASARLTINKGCKNKSETGCQTNLCELTDTFIYSWVPDCCLHKLPLSHPHCAITTHTDCHCYKLVPDPCYMFSSSDHKYAVPELCT
jgi:hypothetical protein